MNFDGLRDMFMDIGKAHVRFAQRGPVSVPLLGFWWFIVFEKFFHLSDAILDRILRESALLNDTLAEIKGGVLEHILSTVDNSLDVHIGFRITFFKNLLDESSDVVSCGEAISNKKNVQFLCRRTYCRRNDKKCDCYS